MNTEENTLFDISGKISNHSLEKIRLFSDKMPNHYIEKLIEIIELISKFEQHAEECLKNNPDDKNIHEWLKRSALSINKIVGSTLLQFARIEGIIKENNTILDK